MTTYTLTGFSIINGGAGNTATFFSANSTLEIVTSDAGGILSYTIPPTGGGSGDTPSVDIFISEFYNARLNDIDAEDAGLEASIGMVEWNDNGVTRTTFFLSLEDAWGLDSIFTIGGDPLPNFANLAEFNDFADNDIIGVSGITSGPFAPGNDIPLADFQDVDISEDDLIIGTALDDVFDGGLGDDTIEGGDGSDSLIGGIGADLLDGGVGFDEADYSTSTSGVTVYTSGRSSSRGDAQGDRLVSIEQITGSEFDDQIILNNSTPTQNFINAGAGDDVVRDRDGGLNDIRGEQGEDRLFGGRDIDDIDGGTDSDLIFGGAGNDFLRGGAGDFRDDIFGSSGDDFIDGEGGNDRLRGNTGEDTIYGGTGDDNIRGGTNSDVLFGDEGNDTIFGDQGNDRIDGGIGNDRLFGGNNNDTFVFSSGYDFDRIFDFQTNRDNIDLTSFALADYDAVVALMDEVAGNVVIDFGSGDILRINDVTIAELDADNFIF